MHEPNQFVGHLILKAKTRQEVADEFGINVRTLARWLKGANIVIPPGVIKPCHLQIIYSTFGVNNG